MGDAMFSRRLWLTNFFSTKLFDCFLMYIIYIKKEIIKPVFYYYFIIHNICMGVTYGNTGETQFILEQK